ncbi:MAG: protease HtpX, partial [Euryarchaeota archaeon]|nr:protease HtpX [Euryarchaeota archaeon]
NGLYIINPALGAKSDRGSTLFSTHPSTNERVRRLREM